MPDDKVKLIEKASIIRNIEGREIKLPELISRLANNKIIDDMLVRGAKMRRRQILYGR
jgi:hypothetical protein